MSTTYDPTAEFYDAETNGRPDSAVEWGIRGEGNAEEWRAFADQLDARRFEGETSAGTVGYTVPEGSMQPYMDVGPHPELRLWQPEPVAYWRGKAKPRGYHLFAKVAVSPTESVALQGRAGYLAMGTPPEEFMDPSTPGDPEQERIDRYADALADDGRVPPHGVWEEPGRMEPPVIEIDTGGAITSHQEGRHRSLAAEQAGLDWMPMYVYREVMIDRWNDEPITYYPNE